MKSLLIIAVGFTVAGIAAVALASTALAGPAGATSMTTEPVTQAGLVWR